MQISEEVLSVTILYTVEAHTTPVWLGFVLLCIVCFTAGLVKLAWDEDDRIGTIGFTIISIALSVAAIYIMNGGKDVQRVYATIDDTKPFVEVMEEYTVHERQGDIWVLDKEKED